MARGTSFEKGGIRPLRIGVRLQPPVLGILAFKEGSFEKAAKVMKYPLLDLINECRSSEDVYRKLQNEDPAMFAPRFIDKNQVISKIDIVYKKVKEKDSAAKNENDHLLALMMKKKEEEEEEVTEEDYEDDDFSGGEEEEEEEEEIKLVDGGGSSDEAEKDEDDDW